MARRRIEAIQRLVIHHSASSRLITAEEIREWHMAKDWKDIGYHFVVEGDGTVVPGRPMDETGAHARGHNEDSLGICVVGDNTDPNEEWGVEQILSTQELIDSLVLVLPCESLELWGHRDLDGAATLCPGLHAQDLFDIS